MYASKHVIKALVHGSVNLGLFGPVHRSVLGSVRKQNAVEMFSQAKDTKSTSFLIRMDLVPLACENDDPVVCTLLRHKTP